MIEQPKSSEDVQEIVRSSERIKVRGGCTKPGLSALPENTLGVDMTGLSGLIEYQPEEYTFTAYAGTPLREIIRALDAHQQYLAFDPPFVRAGATLGGTVASGLSGPGRYRSGGVRDFLLGVRFVDGMGTLIRGGGKVVKNAAGFDFPKLMVGSLGNLGVLVELTFKVFPRPAAYATLFHDCPDLTGALEALTRAAMAQVDLEALDLEPLQEGYRLWARISGLPMTFDTRIHKLQAAIGGGEALHPDQEPDFWQAGQEFSWAPSGWSLVKAPVIPSQIAGLERELRGAKTLRRYSVGGQVAWIALDEDLGALRDLFERLGLNGLVFRGSPQVARLGERTGQVFYERIRSVLDPQGRFVEV